MLLYFYCICQTSSNQNTQKKKSCYSATLILFYSMCTNKLSQVLNYEPVCVFVSDVWSLRRWQSNTTQHCETQIISYSSSMENAMQCLLSWRHKYASLCVSAVLNCLKLPVFPMMVHKGTAVFQSIITCSNCQMYSHIIESTRSPKPLL